MTVPVVLDQATFAKFAEAYHQTRRELRNLKHTLATLERSGRSSYMPKLRRLAYLTEELTAGGEAAIAFLRFNNDHELIETGETGTVHDFWFNTGETAPVNTKIIAELFGHTWIAAEIYCAASDTLP